MTTATLTLHSQAVHTYNGADGDGLSTTGLLRSGDRESNANATIAATALRFALPGDFGGSETITSAVLNLYARTGVPQTSAGYGDHKSRIRVLAQASQVLPSLGSSVLSASGGSEEKTIGEGTFSPVLDYTVTTSIATKTIDIAAILTQAVTAGRLSGGFLVILIQPVSYDEANYLEAEGLNNSNPPTIDIDYVEGSLADNYELVLDGDLTPWTLSFTAEVSESNLVHLDQPLSPWTIDATIATVDTLTLSQPFSAWTLTARASAAIFAQADLVIQNWSVDAVAQLGEGRQAELIGDFAAWTIQSELAIGNPLSLDQSLSAWSVIATAQVSIRDTNRSLFPRSLFPENLHTF